MNEIKKLYMPLVAGKDGQGMQWSLPSDSQPGNWHSWKDDDAAALYQAMELQWLEGSDATEDPVSKWQSGAQCYEVEVQDNGGNARLVRRLSASELVALGIFVEGNHALTGYQAMVLCSPRTRTIVVDGDAKVVMARPYSTNSDLYQINAYGNAQVEADDVPKIIAYDNAVIVANGVTSVHAYGKGVNVHASGSAHVSVCGKGKVIAMDNAFVCVYYDGSPTVEASGASIVETRDSCNPVVIVGEGAVWIDRRTSRWRLPPTVQTSKGVIEP